MKKSIYVALMAFSLSFASQLNSACPPNTYEVPAAMHLDWANGGVYVVCGMSGTYGLHCCIPCNLQ